MVAHTPGVLAILVLCSLRHFLGAVAWNAYMSHANQRMQMAESSQDTVGSE